MRIITFILFVLSIKLNSCTPCTCTLMFCECSEPGISIEANAENNIDGSYAEQEINDFYLIRTNENFNVIDSVKMEFENHGENVDYNRFFQINQATFPDNENLRQFNFLIKNFSLESIDTLSSISYTEQMESRICNHCTGCDDQYIDCLQYSDLSLFFNGTEQDYFIVRINKTQD